jgi:sugar/nucleoside kinase (ribokinase family)
VTKLGARGACARRGTEHVACPGFRVEAIDTTGAGDSFDAGFLYGYLSGLGLEASLRWGCACGALATTRVGGIEGQPTVGQVQELLVQ